MACANFEHKLLLFRFTEVFAALLTRQLKLGDNRSAGAAIYVEAILQYLRLSPNLVNKGIKALPNYMPTVIRQKVYHTFVPNMYGFVQFSCYLRIL